MIRLIIGIPGLFLQMTLMTVIITTIMIIMFMMIMNEHGHIGRNTWPLSSAENGDLNRQQHCRTPCGDANYYDDHADGHDVDDCIFETQTLMNSINGSNDVHPLDPSNLKKKTNFKEQEQRRVAMMFITLP